MNIRTLVPISASLLLLAVAGCEVEKTADGDLPDVDVDVDGGQLPEYDVDGPDVDIERKTVEVPTIDIDPAGENDAEAEIEDELERDE